MVRLRFFAAALVIGCFAPWSRGQLTTMAYDGFNYSTGASLTGQNGGTGWTSAWIKDYGSASNLVVGAGLTYSGLSTVGGSAIWGSGGGIDEASRSLPSVNSGVVYIQFLGQFGSSSSGGTPNLRLLSGGTLTGGIGANGGTYGGVISILGSDLNPASNGSSSTSAGLSSLNLIITRIDYTADVTQIWADPNLATFDYSNPGTPNATYSGFAPAFDTIAFYTRNPGKIDELTVYSVVPEPADVALAAGGVVLVFATVRRRRGRSAA